MQTDAKQGNITYRVVMRRLLACQLCYIGDGDELLYINSMEIRILLEVALIIDQCCVGDCKVFGITVSFINIVILFIFISTFVMLFRVLHQGNFSQMFSNLIR